MKAKRLKLRVLLSTLFLTTGFLACSDGDNNDFSTPRSLNVKGKVEKGPFVSGSTITIQPLNEGMQALGSMYNATILNDAGNFSFESIEFQTPYAEMMATGYFFNEVEGSLSKSVLVLRALVDLSDNTTVNVNMLTHLKYARVKHLISAGKSFKEANNQAQNELLTAFGLQKYVSKDASQFSITGGTDESAALIAISSLLIYNRSEAALTEYLAKLSQEFATNGTFAATTQNQINDDKKELISRLNLIKENIIERYKSLGVNVSVKELTAYLDWDNDGVAGNETLKEGQSVKLQTTGIAVPKAGGSYAINIDSPIPVFTTPMINGPSSSVGTGGLSIYEEGAAVDISYEAKVEEQKLKIVVAPAQFRKQSTTNVAVYDCIGNVVATVAVTQEPDENAKLPLLGALANTVVTDIAKRLGEAFGHYNILEQYYSYNKDHKTIPLSGSDSYVSGSWSKFFAVNAGCLSFKEVEAQELSIYQEIFDVFYALYYYNMVVAWGDLPYNDGKSWGVSDKPSRTNKDVILSDLKKRLSKAIETLEEKKNQSLADANGFFFVSKDVARIVLANINMYQGNWSEAKALLAAVRDNSYYQLYTKDEYEEANTGLIFGLKTLANGGTRSAPIITPALMPIQSLTDVYLSSAECNYHLGNISEAKALLDAVTTTKNISVSADILTGIKEARLQTLFYSGNYFAFLKRNNLAVSECGIENYQLLFPIPQSELSLNPSLTQNSGY